MQTKNLGYYVPDVQNDSAASDFFPGVGNNFEKIDQYFFDTWISVKALGAEGDGTAPDSAAFQKALDIAKDNGGVNIMVPPGTYSMTAELRAYANTKIMCAPGVRIVRNHSKYILINGVRDTPTAPGGYGGAGKLHINGGIWDGNGVNQTSKASIFHIGHATNIKVEHATFMDASNSHHIEFNACSNIRVTNNKFLGWVGTVDDFNEAIQLDLAKTNNTTILPADQTPCKDVVIRDNYFGSSGTPGSNRLGRAVGSHSATIGVWHEDVTVEGNTIENTLSWAVRAYSWRNSSVINNKMINCGAGINLRTPDVSDTADTTDVNGVVTNKSQDCEGNDVSGNRFFGGGNVGRAIEIYGESTGKHKDVTVIGNRCFMSNPAALEAVILTWSEGGAVQGNIIRGSGNSGIKLRDNSMDISVSGNTIEDPAEYGIEVATNCHYATISGNIIRRSGNSGIYAAGLESISITGNNIAGVNGKGLAGTEANHIRLVSAVKRASITGNVCRDYSTTHKTTHALYVTNTCEAVATAGNSALGFTWYNGSINKGSTAQANTDIFG